MAEISRRVDPEPQLWDAHALAAEIAAAIHARTDDERLIWGDDNRREVKVDYARALNVPRASQRDATRLRDALKAELRGAWLRDTGWWVSKQD